MMREKSKSIRTVSLLLLCVLMVSSFFGCSSKNEENHTGENKSTQEESDKAVGSNEQGDVDQGIKDIYANYVNYIKENGYEGTDEIIKKVDDVISIHKKAYEFCGDSYYYEENYEVTNDKENTKNKEASKVLKGYQDRGNVRIEEYDVNGNPLYITVYNAKTDTTYFYDKGRNNLNTITQASKKGRDEVSSRYGCFFPFKHNLFNGTKEEVDYEGKKAICYSNDDLNIYNAVWCDKENGIMLAAKQTNKQGNFTVLEKYKVKPNQEFDPIIFTFNENKLTADELLK